MNFPNLICRASLIGQRSENPRHVGGTHMKKSFAFCIRSGCIDERKRRCTGGLRQTLR
jgi:hypothetical protein